jgi:predicted O-methyltransferase YrrM
MSILDGAMIKCNLPPRRTGKLYETLPSGGIVAEIGVWRGDNAKSIYRNAKPKKLYLIDSWEDLNETYNDKCREHVVRKFSKHKNVEIIKGAGIDIASRFSDAYFDWIYIDADHRFESSLKELKVFSSKIKPKGFIAGHDYDNRYGVFEAVNTFCKEFKWKMVYLTRDKRNNSYVITRI